MLKFQKILCPIDFGEPCNKALHDACELAEYYGAQLLLMHVLQPIQPIYGMSPYPQFVAFDSKVYEKASEDNIRRDLGALSKRGVAPSIDVRTLVQTGIAADELLKAAKQEGIDLIVMATHGRTGWRHQVFGSVTEQVLREARCPVLTVR